MNLSFEKYHGLGNDFIFVDEKDVVDVSYQQLARQLCDRHTGIGADGLIIVKQDPLEMIYYNSDGSRAKMCGNGIRCFAQYCIKHNIVDTPTFTVHTLAGEYTINSIQESPFMVQVNMGQPSFESIRIPLDTTSKTWLNKDMQVIDKTLTVSSLFMGTTHTTVEVDDLDHFDVETYGETLHKHALFPERTNVNFYQILDADTIRIRTYERGAGITLACGTGASAVYAVLVHTKKQTEPITFQLPLGTMTLHRRENNDIIMTGPARFVFAGEIGVII